MTVYAPVEQQPKLGRRRDELTEVKILVNFICVDFLYSASPFYSFFLSVYTFQILSTDLRSCGDEILCFNLSVLFGKCLHKTSGNTLLD